MRFPRHYIIIVTACMSVLAGCNAGPIGNTEPTPTPITAQVPASGETPLAEKPLGGEPTLAPGKFTDGKGLPFPVPSTQANPILSLNRDVAWGNKPDIKEIPASIDADHVLILKAVSEDGKRIAGLVVPRDQTNSTHYKVVLLDVGSRQIIQVDTISAANEDNFYSYSPGVWTRIGLTLHENWLLWQENKTINIYNITTHDRSQIETGTDIQSGIVGTYMPPTRLISMDHGTVVWAEAVDETPPKGKVATVVKSAELASGQVSVIGKYGVKPVIAWPNVAWIEPDTTTDMEGQVLARLVILNMETGVSSTLSGVNGLTEIAISGDAVVSTSWDEVGTAVLTNMNETRRQVISPQQGSEPQEITLNDRLVTWSAGYYGATVWDRKLERLVNLGDGVNVGATLINKNALAWEVAPNYDAWLKYQESKILPGNMTIFVLDTSQLP